MVVVEVREDDLRDRRDVELLGDAPLELSLHRPERVGPPVAPRRVGDRVGMQAGVD